MIRLILVGIYALPAKRIRVTHSFALNGAHARNFGVTLIVLAIPAIVFLNVVFLAVVLFCF